MKKKNIQAGHEASSFLASKRYPNFVSNTDVLWEPRGTRVTPVQIGRLENHGPFPPWQSKWGWLVILTYLPWFTIILQLRPDCKKTQHTRVINVLWHDMKTSLWQCPHVQAGEIEEWAEFLGMQEKYLFSHMVTSNHISSNVLTTFK